MSKSIKVSIETYHKLEAIMEPRESFNDVIVRLFRTYDAIYSIRDTLGSSHPVVVGSQKETTE